MQFHTKKFALPKGIQQLEKQSEINQSTRQNQTMGQELLDLNRAHKQGVISNTEYEQAKADILKDIFKLT